MTKEQLLGVFEQMADNYRDSAKEEEKQRNLRSSAVLKGVAQGIRLVVGFLNKMLVDDHINVIFDAPDIAGLKDAELVCFGCGHCVGNARWPGRPSGERPCSFCIRNPEVGDKPIEHATWYDGSPAIKAPMDCYHSVDMVLQIDKWGEKAKVDKPPHPESGCGPF